MMRTLQVEQAQAEVQRLQTRLKVYEPPWADPTTGKFEVNNMSTARYCKKCTTYSSFELL
jgi:hypothetical protein